MIFIVFHCFSTQIAISRQNIAKNRKNENRRNSKIFKNNKASYFRAYTYRKNSSFMILGVPDRGWIRVGCKLVEKNIFLLYENIFSISQRLDVRFGCPDPFLMPTHRERSM